MALIRHNEISLPLPPGWEDHSQVLAVGPREGNFRPNIVITFEFPDGNESVEHFARRQLPSLQKSLDRLEVIAEGPVIFGGLSGYLREYRFVINNITAKQLQFHVLAGPKIYTFTYTDLPDRPVLDRRIFHIPPNLVVEHVTAHRKPPEVRIWRLRNQSRVGTLPPSTSTPHRPACLARHW
jgi:hypothetical protein